VKQEKLRQIIKHLLKGSDLDKLTTGKIKRAIEDELGLEEGDLESQSEQVSQILAELINTEEDDDKEQNKEAKETMEMNAVKEKKAKEKEKPKITRKAKRKQEADSSGDDGSEGSSNVKKLKNEEGFIYFELHDILTRATVKEFKGNTFVDLRKYYKKKGRARSTDTQRNFS